MTSATQLDPSPEAQAYTAEQNGHPIPLGSSLTAAATRLTKKSIKRAGTSGKAEGWQEDAWDMFDLVGEQRFLATTLANRLSQARFFVGRLPDNPTEDIEVVTEGAAYDVFASMAGNGSRFAQMVARAGVNLFIAGDGYLLGRPTEPIEKQSTPLRGIFPFGKQVEEEDPIASIDIDALEWGMYSVSELTVDSKTGKITVTRDGKEEFGADEVVLIRVWRPHPNKWASADSPTRSSLPVLRELVGLTMHISAQIDSRLAGAGVFLVPASADAALRHAQGANTDPSQSPFADAMMTAMITPIADRSNASAIVPLMPVVPDESIDKFRFISFASPLDTEARALRDEAIRRLALGEDCPPELLLGVGGMNHWGAWLVREDVVTTHVEPPLALLCDAITTEFLWPVLEQQDGIDKDEARQYVIWYDVDHLIQRPNRSQDAKDAKGLGIISDESARDALGFDESDAPDIIPTDPVVDLVLEMVRQAPSLAQTPGLSLLAEQVRAMLEGEVVPPTPETEEPPAEESAPAEEPPAEEPDEGGIPATADNEPEEPQ